MPENHELEQQIEELKALITAQANKPNDVETAIDKSGKVVKWIQSIIAVVVVVVGLGVNYGVTKTKMEVLEDKVTTYERILTERIGKSEQDIHELQLKQAGDDQLLQTMQSDITEIKGDVKALVERRHR